MHAFTYASLVLYLDRLPMPPSAFANTRTLVEQHLLLLTLCTFATEVAMAYPDKLSYSALTLSADSASRAPNSGFNLA